MVMKIVMILTMVVVNKISVTLCEIYLISFSEIINIVIINTLYFHANECIKY